MVFIVKKIKLPDNFCAGKNTQSAMTIYFLWQHFYKGVGRASTLPESKLLKIIIIITSTFRSGLAAPLFRRLVFIIFCHAPLPVPTSVMGQMLGFYIY